MYRRGPVHIFLLDYSHVCTDTLACSDGVGREILGRPSWGELHTLALLDADPLLAPAPSRVDCD